jgi:hypothetical protein
MFVGYFNGYHTFAAPRQDQRPRVLP